MISKGTLIKKQKNYYIVITNVDITSGVVVQSSSLLFTLLSNTM